MTTTRQPVSHIDPTSFNAVPIIEQMRGMAFQARHLAQACDLADRMERERLTVILTLAGGTISAGMKTCITTLLKCHMVDAIVSTGATMIDMDLLEALGFRRYLSTGGGADALATVVDDDDLRKVDETNVHLARLLEGRPHSSREIMHAFGRLLAQQRLGEGSVLRTAYELQVPIFTPSFSDCAAGFGFVKHQVQDPPPHCTHDSVADFRELTEIKIATGETGLLILGGGVPKNFAADIVTCAEVLGHAQVRPHKYAVQLTTADDHSGASSAAAVHDETSGPLPDAAEQMVYGEFSLSFPLMVSYLYHRGAWQQRQARRLNLMFKSQPRWK